MWLFFHSDKQKPQTEGVTWRQKRKQLNLARQCELATELKQLGKHITIETAGTILPGKIPCDLASLTN